MRCLVAVDEPGVRDAVAQAAVTFEGIEVDKHDVEGGRDALRRRKYDFGFVTLKSASTESMALFDEIRELARDIILVALTPSSAVSGKRAERGEHNLFALLGTPIDVVEIYATLRRLIDRLKKSPQRAGST